jgi:hypothetical protein
MNRVIKNGDLYLESERTRLTRGLIGGQLAFAVRMRFYKNLNALAAFRPESAAELMWADFQAWLLRLNQSTLQWVRSMRAWIASWFGS